MRFLHRSHYCENCSKRVFFTRFTTRKFIEEKFVCPECRNDVISYWENLRLRFIIPIIIGISFLSATVIYGIWRISRGESGGVDILISVINVILTGVIAVYGNKYRLKKKPLSFNDHKENGLKLFRRQSLYVVIFTAIGHIIALSLDAVIFYIWKGIENAIQ
ncbi:MAG: hypothetical protein KAS63_07935 [Candidatus Heimdallarchaeota archaeon]|nr:hypothetical protein [Candidatus Heimdallarchaeota archaeon]MCK4955279.1 hypothetical protein [Candidatus Heimdallarchaeota archaeon]